MKKFFAVVCSALTLASCAAALASCGGNNEPVNVETSPSEILSKLKEKLGDGYQCDGAISAESLASYYALDTDSITAFAAEESTLSFRHPDVVIILEVKDGYAEEAIDSLNEAFDQKASYSFMYSVEVSKVQGTRLYNSGNYVALITAGASGGIETTEEEEAKLAVEEYKKVDEAWKEIFGSVPENKVKVPDFSASGEWEIMPQE